MDAPAVSLDLCCRERPAISLRGQSNRAGVPLLLAVAIFAVAHHPIRHAADVKPYASDLLAALALFAAAFEWWRSAQGESMWVLAAVAPVAIALSYPAVFVAGGIALGLLPAVVRARRPIVWTGYATFAFGTVGMFLALYSIVTHGQAAATLATMRAPWAAGFLPLHDGLALFRWLVTVHTGDMFAYPCGGKNGASSLTVLVFAVGAGVLWHQRGRGIVLTCLAPFGLALVAAAIKRYPYGGVADGSPARIMQYLVPSICLLTGVGAAYLLGLFRNRDRCQRVFRLGMIGLVAVGVIPLAAESFHPFRSIHAQRAREFARRFWPEFVRDAEPVCLRWDLGLGGWDSTNLNVAVYLCNQKIYAPNRRPGWEPCWQDISASRPLRCVLSLADPTDRPVASCLDAFKEIYRLRDCRKVVVEMAEPGATSRTESYFIYEFVPSVSSAVHERVVEACLE